MMKKMIKHDVMEEEFDLINGLAELFKEIDINGDGSMEFEEFASYLIEAVEARKLSAKDLKD
jgi:Ca2+-binding EF-hand superfamily protein